MKKPAKPERFSDSFTTLEACFSVEVTQKDTIAVAIDCNGRIHADAELIDLLVEMLENAQENLRARQLVTMATKARARKAKRAGRRTS